MLGASIAHPAPPPKGRRSNIFFPNGGTKHLAHRQPSRRTRCNVGYAVCKYIRNKEAAEHAILMLHNVLRFAVLNNLSEFEKDALHEFEECERISRQPLNYGLHFEAALKLLDFWKKEALTYRHKKRKRRM